MNAIIERAHEIRKEAAAKFGGKAGQYDMGIACQMAKDEIKQRLMAEFNRAGKMITRGVDGLKRLIDDRAVKMNFSRITEDALTAVVGRLYAEYKAQAKKERRYNFALHMNLEIGKLYK